MSNQLISPRSSHGSQPTILHLAHPSLEVVQRQVRHLLFDVVQVHRGEGVAEALEKQRQDM